MKKIFFLLILAISQLYATSGLAQNAANYSFRTTTGVALENISVGSTSLFGPGVDDAASAAIALPFNFIFSGTTYSQFAASSNGLIGFGSLTSQFSNLITGAGTYPILMPFWDDLYTGTNGGVRYKILGSVGSRKLVVEWTVTLCCSSIPYDRTFQAWLFEGSNAIQYVYGTGINNSSSSIGIARNATDYLSITVSNSTASSTTPNDNNTQWPGSGVSYIIEPAAGALNFGGDDDYVSINNTLGNFGTGDFTVEMNVRTALAGTYFLSKRNVCNNDNMISMQTANGKFAIEVSDGGAGYASITSAANINDNQWHHIALTRKSGSLTAYIDGASIGTSFSNANISNSYLLTLGKSICNGQNTSVIYNGDMDELRIWNRSLCQGELQQYRGKELPYTSGNGLQAYYKFNQGSINTNNSTVTTLIDATGNNNGTLYKSGAAGFALTGLTSNWVGGFASGTATLFSASASITASGPTTFCPNNSVVLTASSGASYLWSNGATTQSITVNQSGNYSVTVTNASGCSATSATTNVTVNTVPSISANSNSPVNAGNAINLSATSGFSTYSWTGPNSFTSTSQSPVISNASYLNAGNYSVTGTTSNNCTASSTTNVVINPVAATALNFDGVNDFVSGNLNTGITGGLTFQTWFKTTVNHGQIAKLYGTSSDQGFDLQINANGTIQLNAYLGNWINANSTGNINVIDGNWHQATVSISNTTASVYVDGVFQTSVNGSASFNQPDAVLQLGRHPFVNSLFFTGSIDEVRLWSDGLCSANIQNNYNCELTGTQPSLVAYYKLNQGFVNANNSTEITATDASGFGRNLALNNFALTGTTSNWVVGTVTGTCAPYVPPTASITVSGATTFCQGGSVTLTANSGSSYLWSNGATTQAINVTASGNYSVTVTNAQGCSGTSTATNVTVNPLPTATISASGPTTFCAGGSVTLTASAGSSYLWSNGATTQSINATTAGNYTVNVTNANSCSATSAATAVTVNTLPQPTILNAGSSQLCAGGSTVLTASGSTLGNALSLDGVNDYVDIVPTAQVNNLGVTGYTLEAWIKPTDVNAVKSIIRKTGDYNLYILNGSLAAEVWPVGGINNTWVKLEGSTSNIAPNVWSHVAAIWNGTSLKLFINGSEITGVLTTGFINDVNENLLIGRSQTYLQPFAGLIDELRIWNTPRTTTQINDNRFSFINPATSGLVAYYKFDEGSGTSTSDATGLGSVGTLTNGATWVVPSTVPISYSNYLWSPGGETTASITVNTTGNYTVTATNAQGCSAISAATAITVNPLPTIICPSNITVNNDLGVCGAIVNYPVATATGTPTPTITYSKASGTLFNVGTTTVTVTATNSCGVVTCTFDVTVVDNQIPVITCPSDINVIATSVSGATVTYTTPVGTDNCSGVTTTRIAGLASGATFPIGVTTVTHQVTDAAGLTAQCSFTVTVSGLAPVVVCPANITVNNANGQCGANVSYAATETQAIPASTITYSKAPGSLFPVGTTTVTATATNAVGSSSCTFTVTVVDTENPVIANCPANITAIATPGICGAAVSFSLAPLAPLVDQQITDIFTGTAGQDQWQSFTAGKTGLLTQVDLYRNGIQDIVNATLSIYQGVGVAGTVIYSGVYNFPTGNNWTGFPITVGNQPTVTAGQVYTIRIQQAAGLYNQGLFLLGGNPGNQGSYYSSSYGLNPGWKLNFKTYVAVGSPSISATDNCGVASFTSNHQSGDVFPVGTTPVTYTAIDNAGNRTTCTFTVTVLDKESPVLVGVPTNATVECNAVPAPPTVTATDNCSTSTPSYTETRVNGDCPSRYKLIRTWSTTDASNNTTTASQTITVQDTQAPILSAAPSNVTVECNAVPAAAVLTATDNCSTPTIVYAETRTNGNCPSNYTLTRTWTATDACGNVSSKSQTITVQDTQAPVLSAAPADVTVECNAVPAAAVLTASDNCDNAPVVAYTETRTNGNCPSNYILTRTWTATDACGNVSSKSQVITVQDTQAPILSAAPANAIVECNAVPAAAVLTATDNCNTPTVVYSQTSTQNANPNNAGNYNYVITRTWRATDACGNVSSKTQTITVQDVTKPVITCPASVTVNCQDNNTSTATGVATGTDNCGPVAITQTQTSTQNASPSNAGYYNYVITRTWKATDVTGNFSTCDQTITVQDVTKPVITCPASVTVNCQDNNTSTATGVATGTDNCGPVAISQTQTSTQNASPNNAGYYNYVITRTWRATDVTGNFSECVQTITVQDITKPVITCPASVTVNCQDNNTSTATGVATATDNCSSPITIAQTDVSTYNAGLTSVNHYNYTITRTWRATDVTGNFSTCDQIITVRDVTAPVITCPAIAPVCNDLAGNTKTLTLTGTDNCNSPLTVSYTIGGATTKATTVSATATASFNIGTSYIYWTVKDVVGNTSTCTTTVVIRPLPVASYVTTNADAFCNKLTITASSTLTGPYSYAWSYNNAAFASTSSIQLDNSNGDGNYSVYSFDQYGCRSAVQAVYNYNKQNMISNYTILANKEVEFHEYDVVQSGSVGIMTAKGDADFKKYSAMTGVGAFVKAPKITVDNNASVPNQIIGVVSIALPTMQYNLTTTNGLPNATVAANTNSTLNDNYKDLKIKSGAVVSLTGTVFGKIDIEEGCVVTFTSAVVNISDLKVGKGPNNGYTTVRFAGNTSVRISKQIMIEEDCRINPDGYSVTFYLGDDKSDAEKVQIKGGNTTFTANIYAPSGKIKVTGGTGCHNHINPTVFMTGLFIADEVESEGRNVAWNGYSCGNIARFVAEPITNVKVVEPVTAILTVKVSPNPSTTDFGLTVISKSEEAVTIKVTDIYGKVVTVINKVIPGSTIRTGSSFTSGTYFVEITQGKERKVVRLVKGI